MLLVWFLINNGRINFIKHFIYCSSKPRLTGVYFFEVGYDGLNFFIHGVKIKKGQGLAKWRYLKNHQPQLVLIKVTKDDDKNCSSALFVGWN
jgi:hypothetical protein